jgi:hypothetical protein
MLTKKLIVLIDKLVQIVISYHWVFFQLNSKLLSIKLRDRYSWVRSLVGSQQTLYNLSLYFSAKHMVLRSDRMVVGLQVLAFARFIWLMFALKKMQIAIPLFKNGLTTYEYLPPLLTLRSLFIVSHKSYLLVKRS